MVADVSVASLPQVLAPKQIAVQVKQMKMTSLYICERDSKFVFEFNIPEGIVKKCAVNMEMNFQHNFQYIQTPSQRLFVIGGGDYQKPEAKTLTQCLQILNNGTSKFDCLSKDALKSPRHGHSISCLRDKFLVVTGSRIDKNNANKSVEKYNIDMDIWFDCPDLNFGRYYHSSCSLAEKFVYVFAGISSATKKYFNSIERFDDTAKGNEKVWTSINIEVEKFPVRQGAGSAQINQNEIMIFGGFGGDFLRDSYIFKHKEGTLTRFEKETPIKLFAYQMPTIHDESTSSVITADWQSKKVLMFNS